MKKLLYRKKTRPLTQRGKVIFAALAMSSVYVEFDGDADVD